MAARGIVPGQWYALDTADGEVRLRLSGTLAGNIYLLFMDFLGARALRKSTSDFHALLKSGEVSANMRTPHSHTPLMLAVAVGYTDVVRLLLQNGADVAAQDNDGNTALGIAKRRGDEGIIDELVRHGAMS